MQPEEVSEALELCDEDIDDLRQSCRDKFTADGIKAWQLLQEYEAAGAGDKGMKAIQDTGAVRDPSLVEKTKGTPPSSSKIVGSCNHLRVGLFTLLGIGTLAGLWYFARRSKRSSS